MYVVFPAVLAAGGGVGGYFLEEGTRDSAPVIPMLLFGVGLGFIIPTVVLSIDSNAYRPTDDGTVIDTGPSSASGSARVGASVDASATVGGSGTTTTAPPKPAKRHLESTSMYRPGALVNFDDSHRTLSFGVPSMQLVPMYSLSERVKFGVDQHYEVRAPIFSVAF